MNKKTIAIKAVTAYFNLNSKLAMNKTYLGAIERVSHLVLKRAGIKDEFITALAELRREQFALVVDHWNKLRDVIIVHIINDTLTPASLLSAFTDYMKDCTSALERVESDSKSLRMQMLLNEIFSKAVAEDHGSFAVIRPMTKEEAKTDNSKTASEILADIRNGRTIDLTNPKTVAGVIDGINRDGSLKN